VYAAPVRASDEPEPAEDDVAADDVGLDDKVAWAVPVAGFWVVPCLDPPVEVVVVVVVPGVAVTTNDGVEQSSVVLVSGRAMSNGIQESPAAALLALSATMTTSYAVPLVSPVSVALVAFDGAAAETSAGIGDEEFVNAVVMSKAS